MTFHPLEKLHQLHDGYRQAFSIAGKQLILIQDKGKPYLLSNRCPHMDAPLTHATINNGTLRCPMHGLEFDLHSGKEKNTNVCASSLEKFPVVYEGNYLGVVL